MDKEEPNRISFEMLFTYQNEWVQFSNWKKMMLEAEN